MSVAALTFAFSALFVKLIAGRWVLRHLKAMVQFA
jgi:hypothetical protein